jgi:trehalose 2-sulfotransferase
VTRYTSYIICTSPRSGSTLLCRMLAATGVAGDPESLFYGTSLDDWKNGLGVSAEAGTNRSLIKTLVKTAIVQGRGATGVFGLRQQRHSFDFLCEQLAVLHPDLTSDLDRFNWTFGSPLFIHLTREDKLRQAISYVKAQESGLWHVNRDGSDYERLAPPRVPEYDRNRITTAVQTFTENDRAWALWFSQQQITPVRITYDQLSNAPGETLGMVLAKLGLDAKVAQTIAPPVRKMSDAVNDDWHRRYLADMPTG